MRERVNESKYCNAFRVMKKYHMRSYAHVRQSWGGAMGVVTRLHQHLPPASTIIFPIRLLRFIQFLCSEVIPVTLYPSRVGEGAGREASGSRKPVYSQLLLLDSRWPSHPSRRFKSVSNENRISNNYETQSFMKPNVPAIMTHDHQSFAAIKSEQCAVEHEAQF